MIDMPQSKRLEYGKQHGGQLGAPDTAGAIVVLATGDRPPDCLLCRIIVHGDFRMIHENRQALPVICQTTQHLALITIEPVSYRRYSDHKPQ